MRRVVHRVVGTTIATATLLGLGAVTASGASAETIEPGTLATTECAPNVTTAVLQRLATLLVVVQPGQEIPYVQIRYDGVKNSYVIEPCSVKVPGSS